MNKRFLPKAARSVVSAERVQALYLRLTTIAEPPFTDERSFQASAIAYLDRKYPQFKPLCFHVPLELLRHEGMNAAMFARLGARAGVADIVMLIPRGIYHGLTVELKCTNRQPTDSQCLFLEAARAQGYAACWTDSLDTLIRLIDVYLQLPARATIAELHATEVPHELRYHRQTRQAHRNGDGPARPAKDKSAVAGRAAGPRSA